MKAPAFQFYAADYLASQRVTLLTLEEEGAYIRALLFCWQHGSIPADPEKLARLIGKGASTTLASTVATMFEERDGVLVHPRLEEEREKHAEWRRKSAEGGRRSAEKRAERSSLKGGSTTLQPPLEGSLQHGHHQKATLQSSSPTPSPLSLPQAPSEEEREGEEFDSSSEVSSAPVGGERRAHPGRETSFRR